MRLYTAGPKMSVYLNAFGYSHDFLTILSQQNSRKVQVQLQLNYKFKSVFDFTMLDHVMLTATDAG